MEYPWLIYPGGVSITYEIADEKFSRQCRVQSLHEERIEEVAMTTERYIR